MAARKTPNPVEIAEAMIAQKKPSASIFDEEPLAGWLVQLAELKVKKDRSFSWKMVASALTTAAREAELEGVPEAGYNNQAVSHWIEQRHPKLFARIKANR